MRGETKIAGKVYESLSSGLRKLELRGDFDLGWQKFLEVFINKLKYESFR